MYMRCDDVTGIIRFSFSLEAVYSALATLGLVYSPLHYELEQLYYNALAAHLYEELSEGGA